MDLDLRAKRAVIGASTGGLGFACAQALCAEGADVMICGRNPERLDAALGRLGPRARGRAVDLSDVDAARTFVEDAHSILGGIDILITNSGGPPPGRADVMSIGAYADAFEALCLSAIAMCDAALPGMRAQRWGRILAITSIAVRAPIANLALSNTARAALTAYLKSLAGEVAADGVTVNSMQPGLHLTDRLVGLHGGDLASVAASLPTRELGEPADFGAIAALVCSPRARFLTGAAIPVDGGAFGGLQ